MIGLRALAVSCAVLAPLPGWAVCRQALALGLDVSGSVDMWEYRLQLDGLAAALADPEVQAAFLAHPQAPVRLMVFEWSARSHQRQLIGWTEVRGIADLAAMARVLRATRSVPVEDPATAIGDAILYGAAQLRGQDECWQLTLDISGDGPANVGPPPGDIAPRATEGVTINGLVIGPDGPANTDKNRENLKTLMEYYTSFVQRGPGAFVEAALDYEHFAQAMRRKLIRELGPAVVSRARPRSADPPSADPRSADPRSADRRSAGPHPADPGPADRRSAGPHPADPRSADPRSADRRSVDVADLVGPVAFDPAQ